ncbi:MAG: hypothetical protein HDR06_04470 [Lachnospiraceae bacterium]|nr:hypothetical protein [Lachnospiraceae bacterium]
MQTWRFTVLKSQDKICRLKEIVRVYAEKAKVHFYGFENPKAAGKLLAKKGNVVGWLSEVEGNN